MTAATARRDAPGRQGPGGRAPGVGRRVGHDLAERAVPAFTALAILFLLLPIIVMIVFSFNDPPGRFNFVWGRFSLAAWANPFARLGLEAALWTSLIVAIISTVVATLLGTMPTPRPMSTARFRLSIPGMPISDAGCADAAASAAARRSDSSRSISAMMRSWRNSLMATL